MSDFTERLKENAVSIVASVVLSALVALGVVSLASGPVGGQLPTYNASNQSYTDSGADIKQNLQFVLEQFANLQQYDVLQVNSAGNMVVVSTTVNGESGGSVLATTTAGTATTLTEAELEDYNYFSVSPNVVADITFTLPASNTLDTFLPNAGDSKRIVFDNTTTTKGTDIAFADGVGTWLLYSSSTPRVLASSTGALTLTRRSNTDVVALFESYSNQ